ncbi:MAG: response regulator [Thauera sp.]|jgi:CheY-like chemotaxis protein|nr:response regulator [Thauera sp.]
MKHGTLKILIVTDVAAEAAQIARLLRDHFDQVETSTVETHFVADFERVKPNVVVLALPSLERAERYSLGLYRHSEIVHTVPHRNIVLCDKDNVHRAFELCSKGYFDDYVMYWPLVFDTPRLPMSILLAGRALQVQREAPPAREVAAHARSVSQLGNVLDEQIAVGQQRAQTLAQTLQEAEGMATIAVRSASSADASRSAAAASRAGALPDSFELDLDGVPSGATPQPALSIPQREGVIREVQLRVNEAKEKVVPLGEWINSLKQDVKPQLDAARRLGELADRVAPLILIVEDDSFQCTLLERLLEKAGYRSASAHSGGEALALLGRQQPDLILMDIDLPDLNGLQITRRLKASPSMAAIPIVMITGHSGRQVLHASLSAGAIDFLVKPFDREVLLQKLARHLAR